MSDDEGIVLELGGKTYVITPDTAAQIDGILANSDSVLEEINGIDKPIVELLEELAEVDWTELIPDEHTRTLIALGLFVDHYEIYEGASELANYHLEYFENEGWCIGQNSGSVLEAIKSGA